MGGPLLSTARARTLRHNPTGPERATWAILWQFREDGWHFRRQQPIGPYYADFACMHAKLVIEVDGETHVDAERDVARDEYMRGRGIQVLRYTNDDVLTNPDGVFTEIAEVLGAITSTSNTPHPVPPPQGGRRRRNRQIGTVADTGSNASVGSHSPLRGGDRGGVVLPAPADENDK